MKTLSPTDQTILLQHLAPHLHLSTFEKSSNPDLPATTQLWKQYRNLLAAMLMLDAGLRVGELVKLRCTDLYFQGHPVTTLCIRKILAKYRHERHIPLTDRLRLLLTAYNRPPYLSPPTTLINPLLPRIKNGPAITTRTVERIITRTAMRCLGFPVHPHMLRHTYATRLMRITDIRTVQELLGHQSVTTTQTYTHTNDQDKLDAIRAMEATPTLAATLQPPAHLPGDLHQ